MAQDLETRVKAKLDMISLLMLVTFFLLAMMMSLKASVLKSNELLTLQLALAIPLLFASMSARTKLGNTEKPNLWEQYGYLSYVVAYAFILNSVGILLSFLTMKWVGIVFILVALLFSALTVFLEYKEKPYLLKALLYKDGILAILLVLGGLLPVLRVY